MREGKHQLIHGEPNRFKQDPIEGYRWLMRAALRDNYTAQADLSWLFSDPITYGGDETRNMIAPDLVQADMWMRLAARDFAGGNSRIEAQMTSAQIDEARKLVANWHPRSLAEVLVMNIDPPPAPPAPKWPKELREQGRVLLEWAGDPPEPWQKLPDFERREEVMAVLKAIADHCAVI